MKFEKIKVFLVDDNALYLKTLELEFLQHSDFTIETFATGELCLQRLSEDPDVIILDYYLNSVDSNAMDGMETLDKIKKIKPNIPVVMLSVAADKIGTALEFMKHKASDYTVKNNTAFSRLQKILSSIFPRKNNGKEIALVYGNEKMPFQLSVVSC